MTKIIKEWIISKSTKDRLGLKVRLFEFFGENLIEVLNYDLSGVEQKVWIESKEIDTLISVIRNAKKILSEVKG
jgi:hypothetical protein